MLPRLDEFDDIETDGDQAVRLVDQGGSGSARGEADCAVAERAWLSGRAPLALGVTTTSACAASASAQRGVGTFWLQAEAGEDERAMGAGEDRAGRSIAAAIVVDAPVVGSLTTGVGISPRPASRSVFVAQL